MNKAKKEKTIEVSEKRMIDAIDLLTEKSELIGKIKQVRDEINFYNEEFAGKYYNKDVIVMVEVRRRSLSFYIKNWSKRCKEISEELRK